MTDQLVCPYNAPGECSICLSVAAVSILLQRRWSSPFQMPEDPSVSRGVARPLSLRRAPSRRASRAAAPVYIIECSVLPRWKGWDEERRGRVGGVRGGSRQQPPSPLRPPYPHALSLSLSLHPFFVSSLLLPSASRSTCGWPSKNAGRRVGRFSPGPPGRRRGCNATPTARHCCSV